MTEFELIDKFFHRYSLNTPEILLGIGDDCAILQPPPEKNLVMTTDALTEDVHFFKNISPADLGYKSLAVSLSDIAAMGAEPAWVLLSLTLPALEENWINAFCEGFSFLLKKFHLSLIGGNTSRGPLSITTQVTGFIPPQKAMRREGAKVGDLIYVTGTVGDAAVGLKVLQKKIKLSDDHKMEMLQRFYRPSPRIEEGMILREMATSAIDISDGLAADLMHILEKSGVGATIKTNRLPLSKTLRTELKPEIAWEYALSGGEDYELCFTIPPALQSTFELNFGRFDCGYICIGKIEEEKGLRILDSEGNVFKIQKKGYEHYND